MTVSQLIKRLKDCRQENKVLFFVDWEDEREVDDVAHGDWDEGSITYLGTKNMPDEKHDTRLDFEI